jgi:DNA-binding Lrp family transcriptional regulator
MSIEEQILYILSENSRVTPMQISEMTGAHLEAVERIIEALERNKTIVKYSTLINWEKTEREQVCALIEVKVTPQREQGFDAIAERIYRFPEVKSLFLMSGDYDLAITVEGKTMKEVAFFVAEKLSVMDSVLSTSTHFLLKKYKVDGVILEEDHKDIRQVITL